MNAITQILLGGAALGALATVPAMAAGAPYLNITALHAGNVVNKTRLHRDSLKCVSSSTCLTIYTSIPASDFRVPTDLGRTYYKWNSSMDLCTTPKMRMKGPKKSTYGRITHNTETYSFGCPSGPTVFYGDAYTLTKASGEGKTDNFLSALIGKVKNNGVKYKGTLTLDVLVTIGE